jgi:hypothetical protein
VATRRRPAYFPYGLSFDQLFPMNASTTPSQAGRLGTLSLRVLGLLGVLLILSFMYRGLAQGIMPWYEAAAVLLAMVVGGILGKPLERRMLQMTIYREHRWKWIAVLAAVVFLAGMLFVTTSV